MSDDPKPFEAPERAAFERDHLEREALPLAEERLVVDKTSHDRRVRVSTRTVEQEVAVDEMLTSVQAEVTRVPVDRMIETVPEIEERDGVTVIPVFEEVLVRQLILKEELHVRTVTESKPFKETVTLRSQEPVVERFDEDGQPTGAPGLVKE